MSKTKQSTIGQRLREIREGLKLSQKEFATQLGLTSESAISIYESGACSPQAETLIKMAEVFRIDVHELLTGKSSPAITVEVERLREIKHRFRKLLNEVRPRVAKLSKLDKEISRAIEALTKGMKPKKSKAGDRHEQGKTEGNVQTD